MEIVFTRDQTITGYLIRYFTKRSWLKSSRTNHVALRYSGSENKWMVQASSNGFLPFWWPKFNEARTVYKRFELLKVDESVLNDVIDNCIDTLVGDKYDFLCVAGIALSVIWYWLTGKKIANKLHRKNTLSCTEAIYIICKKVKEKTTIDYFGDLQPQSIFPDEMLAICENKIELFKVLD